MSDDPDSGSSRRRFVKTIGVAGAFGLAGCPSDSESRAMGQSGDGGDVEAQQGTPTGTGEEVTVELAMPSNVTDNADATREALYDAGLRESINVEFLSTSEISGDVQAQYRSWLNAGRETPDIFRMDSGWTIPFIVRDQLVNLSERLSDDALSMIEEHYFDAPVQTARAPANAAGGGATATTPGGAETTAAGTETTATETETTAAGTETGTATAGPGGELYGVPWQVGFPTVQYRKDLVEDAGFDPEGNNWATEPMTWQQFSEVISETHSNADVEYGFNWQGTDYVGLSCCTFNEFMSTWGGAYFGGRENLFGPVGERPITVDEEPVVQALQMVRTLIHGSDDQYALDDYQQISPNAVLEWTEGPSLQPFTNGNAVAVRYWPDAIFEAATAFEESGDLSPDALGTMPIPYAVTEEESDYEGVGGTAAALGGWHLTVNPNSQNVDAAVEVIEATMQEEFRAFQFSELGYLTADQRLFDPANVEDVEPWGPHLETLQIAGENAIPRPVTVVWPDQSSQIASRVNGVIAQQQAPEDAMSQLAGTIEQIEESV